MSRQAAIWKISPEILSNIFDLGYQGEVKKKVAGRYVHWTFPVKLSHVSRYFRNVAIRTCTLWTDIHIRDLRSAEVEYIKTCLERSGTLPLRITFECSSWNTEGLIMGSAVAQAMSFIQAHVYRLQSLQVGFDSSELIQQVTRHLDQPAPQLKTLELLDHGNELHGVPMAFSSEMTQIDNLHVFQVPISWSYCDFKNLVVLHLQDYFSDLGLFYEEFWDIIENSPSLRKLILEWSELFGLPTDDPEPCVLNSLEELQLIGSSITCLAVIPRLHAPNMKVLVLSHLVTSGYSELLTQIAGPPMPFPNLVLLDFVFVVVEAEAVEALRHAYGHFRRWYASWDKPYSSEPPRLVLFATSLGGDT